MDIPDNEAPAILKDTCNEMYKQNVMSNQQHISVQYYSNRFYSATNKSMQWQDTTTWYPTIHCYLSFTSTLITT